MFKVNALNESFLFVLFFVFLSASHYFYVKVY